MPFPFEAAAAGIGLISSLFQKKKKAPPMPQFFVNNPEELQAMIRQSAQSQYGGFNTNLRENLSNAGILSPSALSYGMTQGGIALGQETLGKFSDIGMQELERSRALQQQDYLMKLEDTLGTNRQNEEQLYSSLAGLGAGLGQIYGQRKKKKKDPLKAILEGTDTSNDEGDIQDADSGVY
jgi:hypothetical protein